MDIDLYFVLFSTPPPIHHSFSRNRLVLYCELGLAAGFSSVRTELEVVHLVALKYTEKNHQQTNESQQSEKFCENFRCGEKKILKLYENVSD